jgi:hypothetical protein
MESISPQVGTTDFARQGNRFGDPRQGSVKTRLEARDLRHIGQVIENSFNRCQIMRLMQRGKRRQITEFSQDLRCHHGWICVPRTAMNDAMSNTDHLLAAYIDLSHVANSLTASAPSRTWAGSR